MKRILPFFLCLALLLIPLAGCTAEKNDKPTVVATLFPQYDFARSIAGDRANVTLLLDFGADAHSYDPTPADMMEIAKADLFIYTGGEMELWAKKLLESADIAAAVKAGSLTVLDLSESVDLVCMAAHEHADEHTHTDAEYDAHIWTSPVNAARMCESIEKAFESLDPAGAALYAANLAAYTDKLTALDTQLRTVTAGARLHEVYFGGSFAFTYLFKDCGLAHHSVFEGCASHAEASAAAIKEIITEMRESGAKYVLYDSPSEEKIAQTIAEETGAEILRLHAIHNITKAEYDAGEDYISLMKSNIEVLGKALG